MFRGGGEGEERGRGEGARRVCRAGRDRRRADTAAARSHPRYSHSYGLHTGPGGGGVFRGGGEGARRGGEERGRGGGPSRSRQTPCRHGRGAQSSSLLSQLRPAHRAGSGGGGCLEGAERGRGGGRGAGRGGGPSRSRQTPCRHGRGAQSSSLLSQLRPAHKRTYFLLLVN